MRVLHFYKAALPVTMAGIPQVIDQLARGTRRKGIKVEVLSLSPHRKPRSTIFNGYRLYLAPTDFEIAATGFSVSAISLFSKLSRRADIIHYHFPWPFMDFTHFITRVRQPTIVSYHADIVRQKHLKTFYRPLQTIFLKNMNCIVAASPQYAETSKTLRKFSDKTRVISYGLDKTIYPTPALSCLEKWRKKVKQTFFLFVGEFRYYKGLHLLLQAARDISYPIVLVGTGPFEKSLKKQAAFLGLKNVHFLGRLSNEDKVALLQLCCAFVFPSHLRSEAFGISLLEAAMYGKPMISCEIGTGTSFINIDRKTGIVTAPNDPAALRHAMKYLWKHPEEAAEMGRQAEVRYWRCFTAEKMVKKYVSLYHELTG